MALRILTQDRGGDIRLDGKLLIVRYPEGDYDVVNRKMKDFWKRLEQALYDEYQVSDTLREGDEFVLAGRIRFECVSVHVLPCDRPLDY